MMAPGDHDGTWGRHDGPPRGHDGPGGTRPDTRRSPGLFKYEQRYCCSTDASMGIEKIDQLPTYDSLDYDFCIDLRPGFTRSSSGSCLPLDSTGPR